MAKRGRPTKAEQEKKEKEKLEQEALEQNELKQEETEPKEDDVPVVKMENKVLDSKPKSKREITQEIPVKSLVNGHLTYISKNNPGYRVDWYEYGEEIYIEYKELLNMRGSQRAFFENPWVICEWEVLKDLNVDKYYKNLINVNDVESFFYKSNDEISEFLSVAPKGIKQLIADKAFEMHKENRLDSIRTIQILEKELGIDLSISIRK